MSVIGAFAVPHPPIIMPEVGRGEERKIQKTADAYREAMRRAAALKPDTVVLTSPHAEMYLDYFHIAPGARASGSLGRFGAPGAAVKTNYDEEFVAALQSAAEDAGIPAGTLGERDAELDHASVIPLRFLDEFYTDYKLVRIGLSGLSPAKHYGLGRLISQVSDKLGRRTVFIASGDLSHKLTPDGPYGFAPQGPEFDKVCTAALGSGDFLSLLRIPAELADGAAECGLRSFWIMAGALDGLGVKSELLSYEGPFGVGYGVAAFEVTGTDESRRFLPMLEDAVSGELAARKSAEDPWVRLARMSLETYVKTGKYAAVPDGLPDELYSARAGAFVSLKKDGRLRGCIGTIGPTEPNLAREIVNNAVSAGTRDPRFPSVRADELSRLVYSVDVLGPTEKISSPEELDVKRYGVIVSCGGRRGLLLPNLEGVDTVAEQISIARQKGGISEHESVTLERFEVVRHH